MLEVLFVLWISYVVLFWLSIYLKDNSIVDIFWGLGFVIIACMTFSAQNWYTSQSVMTLLVIAWGVRLTINIGTKKFSHSWEDARYARWRKSWKYFYLRSFFQVYMLQAILMLWVASPIIILNTTSGFQEHIFLTLFWWMVALFGLIYETVADSELKQFIRTKKQGEILTHWLRRFHRYPQYFGESVFWLWTSIIAAQVSLFAFGWWMLISFLLVFVSGVPLLEKRYEWNKKYQKYSEETPVFFPDFKR